MIARGEHLLREMPRGLPRELHLLGRECEKEITAVVARLRQLLKDPQLQHDDLQGVRLREFRRAVKALDLVETMGVVALVRYNKDDLWLNQLLKCITDEINYPLLPPVVTSLSEEYFQIYIPLGVLRVPPVEGAFLLHLPDLYHELAHPLLAETDDPRVQPFRQALLCALGEVRLRISAEQKEREMKRDPLPLQYALEIWRKSWSQFWMTELFCDLFALYAVGPAYAWAHLHLVAKRGHDPFSVPTLAVSTHPADDFRMNVMLDGMRRTGFQREAVAIETRWNRLIHATGFHKSPEYVRCFPQDRSARIAQLALAGIEGSGCAVARPGSGGRVRETLNSAWTQFWSGPSQYPQWEKGAVSSLRGAIC